MPSSLLDRVKLEKTPFYVCASAEYFRCWHLKNNKQFCAKRFNLNLHSSLVVEDEFNMQTRCGRFANVLEAFSRDYYKIEDTIFSDEYIIILQESFVDSLDVWLRSNPFRAAEAAQQIVEQLLPTLACMEKEDIFHRGLGLHSVFVTSESPLRLKLGEFGDSQLSMGMSATTLIQPETYVLRNSNPLHFIERERLMFDPELLGNPAAINSNKTSVYMLGVLLADCLLGGRLSVYEKISIDRALQDAAIREAVSASRAIKAVLELALRPSKAERPTFQELMSSTGLWNEGSAKLMSDLARNLQSIVLAPNKRLIQEEESSNTSSKNTPESFGIGVTESKVPTDRNTSILAIDVNAIDE